MKLLLDENLPLSVVMIRAASNDIDDIRQLLPSILSTLRSLTPWQITFVP